MFLYLLLYFVAKAVLPFNIMNSTIAEFHVELFSFNNCFFVYLISWPLCCFYYCSIKCCEKQLFFFCRLKAQLSHCLSAFCNELHCAIFSTLGNVILISAYRFSIFFFTAVVVVNFLIALTRTSSIPYGFSLSP